MLQDNLLNQRLASTKGLHKLNFMILKAAIGDGSVDYFVLMSGLTCSRVNFTGLNQLVLGNY